MSFIRLFDAVLSLAFLGFPVEAAVLLEVRECSIDLIPVAFCLVTNEVIICTLELFPSFIRNFDALLSLV